MPPTQRVATTAVASVPRALAAPPPVLPDTTDADAEQEERIRVVFERLAIGHNEKSILRQLQRMFAVTHAQAKADFDDAARMLRAQLDDEGAIDGVVAGALARLQILQRRFCDLALEPIPLRIREVPAPMPADPNEPYDPDGPGSTWRSLTPGEYASAVGARAVSAKVALNTNQALVQISGRRSTRWAEKPALVVVQSAGSGFTKEEAEFLKGIGVLK